MLGRDCLRALFRKEFPPPLIREKLKGKIVSALFHTVWHFSTHFHAFSEFFQNFPSRTFLRFQGFYCCFSLKRTKKDKKKSIKPFCTLAVARLSSSDLNWLKSGSSRKSRHGFQVGEKSVSTHFSPIFVPQTHFWTHFSPLTKTRLKATLGSPKKGPEAALTQHNVTPCDPYTLNLGGDDSTLNLPGMGWQMPRSQI